MPETLLNDILEIAWKDYDEQLKVELLIKMLPLLSEPLQKDALKKARELNSIQIYVALLKFAPSILEPLDLIELSRWVEDEQWNKDVLEKIEINKLKINLKIAFEISRKIRDEPKKAETLASIAPLVSESEKFDLLKDALNVSKKIKDKKWKAAILARLLPHLPDIVLDEPPDVMSEVLSDPHAPEMMAAIGCNLRDAAKILDIVRIIRDDYYKQVALAIIAPNVSESNELLRVAKEISNEQWRAEALVKISPYLQESSINNELALAYNISHIHWRVKALIGIAQNLSNPQKERIMRDVLIYIKKINEPYWTGEAVGWLVSSLTEKEALMMVSIIRTLSQRPEVIAKLALKLPEPQKSDLLHEALINAKKLTNNTRKVRLLVDISPNLCEAEGKETITEALRATREIIDDRSKAKIIADISSKIPEIHLESLLAIAKVIEHGPSKMETLINLSSNLPESQRKTHIVQAIELAKIHNIISELLEKISVPLSSCPHDVVYPIWQDLHYMLARRYRGDLLSGLSALAPLILAMGGIEALEESCQAIKDVSKWWP